MSTNLTRAPIKQIRMTCFGEILWDIFPDGRNAGGAPFNVSYHLSKMGADTAMISRIGNDELGLQLLQKLRNWQIPTQYIQTDTQYSTGTVIATIEPNNEPQYDIIAPVAWDYIEWAEMLEQRVKHSDAFVFGSLGARDETARDTLWQLLEVANYKVFDINLRPPFVDFKHIQQLMKQSDLVKLNLSEMEQLLFFMGKTFSDTGDSMAFLTDYFHLDGLILTKSGQGASYLTGDVLYTSDIVPVTISDTVGSGDSFLAGFLSGKFLGLNPEEQPLYNASMLAAFVTSQVGATPEYDSETFEAFKNENTTPKHNRKTY
ncbi:MULTISPECIES: carbohydrate kinase family protein [Chitinophagaceae]